MKKIIIIGAIIFSVGIGMFFIGFASSGFDFNKLQNYTYEKKTYETSEDITEIKLNDINTEVEIIPTNTDRVSVEYFINDRKQYDITEKDGVLSLFCNYKIKVSIFNINFQKIYTKIQIPANKKVKLSVQTTNDKIILHNLNFIKVDLATTNSSIVANDISVDEDFSSTTTNAKLALKGISANNIFVKTTNSKVSAMNLEAKTRITINSSNGDISVSDILAQDISLVTTNGDISGILKGKMSDYYIMSSTTNGKNNLPTNYQPQGYTKKLFVKTTNNDISFIFDEK